jgi:hypothetical protein
MYADDADDGNDPDYTGGDADYAKKLYGPLSAFVGDPIDMYDSNDVVPLKKYLL